MRKLLTYTTIVLIVASFVGYILNHFTKAMYEKKIEKIIQKYEAEKTTMQHQIDALTRKANEAGRKAEAAKAKADRHRTQKEAIQIPKTAEETVERLHKAGFTSARVFK